ncbi:MAG: nucleoside deaminase [Candidatus Eremiobacteraeota bacterium]|nr:nucleoside deaminase [Candidatus Eremiobacteraeota bacterium]
MTQRDERYMDRALALAGEAVAAGDVPVGAVLVSGELAIEARNEKESRADATAHAEMLVLREASRRFGTWRLEDATLYVTKEPCVMCAGAMIAARIKRLVYAANDPKGGADGGAFDILRSQRTNHRIDIEAGVLQTRAAAQLREFFEGKRDNRQSEGIESAAP